MTEFQSSVSLMAILRPGKFPCPLALYLLVTSCVCKQVQKELWVGGQSALDFSPDVGTYWNSGRPLLISKSAKLQAAAASESNNLFVTLLPMFSLSLFCPASAALKLLQALVRTIMSAQEC